MEMVNINMKTEIFFKAIILKMKKEEKVSITLQRVEYYNHNLILTLHKYQKFIWSMEQSMLVNIKMDQEMVQEKPLMLMVVSMMENG